MIIFILVYVKFSQQSYSTMESSEKLQGTIISSGPLQTSYDIKLKCSPGNATGRSLHDN